MTEELVFPEPVVVLIDGIAVWAQACTVKTVRETRYIEAFGEEEPIAVLPGKMQYHLRLKRVRVDDKVQQWRSLVNFTLSIRQGEDQVVYYGCEWESIQEVADENGIYEEMVLNARYRTG